MGACFLWLVGLACLAVCGCDEAGGDGLTGLLAGTSTEARAETPEAAKHSETRPANRLARESSPYLLQHAHNPVDWYAWGPEALEAARTSKKPIFLSIGYSSCHWCHVMERLVFENEEIARQMNEHFICIKVDREERPDVDDIYMTALQVYFQAVGSDQGGGWPLSMFLTPDGKPIAGGTYFPPDDKAGRMGFPTVMSLVAKQWDERREDVEKQAGILARETQRIMGPRLVLETAKPSRALVTAAVAGLLETYDSDFGGLDFHANQPDGPKFPVPAKLALLQYESRRHGHETAEQAVRHTLQEMAAGGIYDHLGGGFHRYSTDRQWHVPHFEKMLYDQALLVDAYVEAFRRTNRREDRETAEGTIAFVLRDLTSPNGAFYSSLDADTGGVEGQYYVWSKADIEKALGEADAALFAEVHGLNEPQAFDEGYVLHLPRSIDDVAAERQLSASELKRRVDDMRGKLLEVRRARPSVGLDDKILTSWNGLMIRALAHAGQVLARDEYTRAAEKAALYLLAEMRNEQGHLLRTSRNGKASLNAYLDDYAFLVSGLLALHETTGDDKWLNAARRLTDDQIEQFWDADGKGFYFTSHGQEQLIARSKSAWDGVLPSGNAVTVRNLVRLAVLTGEDRYRQYAKETLTRFAPMLKQSPKGMATLALAMDEYLDQPGVVPAEESGAVLLNEPAQPQSPAQPATDEDAAELPSPRREGVILPVAGEESATKDKEELVAARAFLSVDKLPPGGKCRVVMFLKVKEGWHINANPAEPDYLIPTTFTLKSTGGIKLTDVQYPPSQKLQIMGIDETVLVYEGRVAIYGTLEIPATLQESDDVSLEVGYQSCNNEKCLAPTKIALKGKIPVAPSADQAKTINANLFPETKRR